MAQWLTNPSRNHEVAGSIPGLTHELWYRSQARLRSRIAVALAQACGYSSNETPSREPPYAVGAAPEKTKKKGLNK